MENYIHALATNDLSSSSSCPPIKSLPPSKIVPGASPRNVTVVALDSRSVKVSWDPPPLETHNGLITNYIIKYWKVKDRKFDGHVVDTIAPVDVNIAENDVPISKTIQDEDLLKVKEISVDASLRSYIVKNLEEWTSYKITVSAATKIGAGPPSANLTIRTDESGMFLDVPTFFISPSSKCIFYYYSKNVLTRILNFDSLHSCSVSFFSSILLYRIAHFKLFHVPLCDRSFHASTCLLDDTLHVIQ